MASTVIEKILARHADRDEVRPGEIVDCAIDFVVQQGDFTKLNKLTVNRAHDPTRVALVMDHTVPAPTIIDAIAHNKGREFARRLGVPLLDVGQHGIIHQVIMERGWARPGSILVSMDSHTIGSGVFNCAAQGLGATEIMNVIATGMTWFRVPETIHVRLTGRPGRGVYGKDIFLAFAGTHGSVEGASLQFSGDGIAHLSLDDRATIATMCQEVSAEFALFPADEILVSYLQSLTGESFDGVESDEDATYLHEMDLDMSNVEPHVAFPGSIPGNTAPIRSLAGEHIRIDQAFVGSCANGKLSDLAAAAQIMRGRRVHDGVRFIVTPASQAVYLEAVRRGYVEDLVAAGAVVTNSTCGACYGGHMGVLAPGETCLTSSTRNFRGRMGSVDARIYIGSSASVAAAAVAGEIVDPREFLG